MGTLPKREDSSTNDESTPDRSSVLYLLGSMADTTWRLFVPILSLLLVGDYLDKQWHTKPWLMLLGSALGASIAALLIKRQLQKGQQ